MNLTAPPLEMRQWRPMWVQTPASRTAPQFYFILYEPGVILADDIKFLYEIPERAADYLTYLMLVDRARGERRIFARRELGRLLEGHWRDFMGLWYRHLEASGLMACSMMKGDARQYGIKLSGTPKA